MTKRGNTPPPNRPSLGALSENKVIRRESADNYSWVLIQFFADCRLILCKHGKQGIVQHRSTKRPNKGVWIGKKHGNHEKFASRRLFGLTFDQRHCHG